MRKPGSLNRKPLEMTPREIEVVGLLCRGYTHPQIAERLGTTTDCVRDTVKRARKGTECETSYQLVAEFAAKREKQRRSMASN